MNLRDIQGHVDRIVEDGIEEILYHLDSLRLAPEEVQDALKKHDYVFQDAWRDYGDE